jgi:hypothetical protein
MLIYRGCKSCAWTSINEDHARSDETMHRSCIYIRCGIIHHCPKRLCHMLTFSNFQLTFISISYNVAR